MSPSLECGALAPLWPKRRQAAALQGGAHLSSDKLWQKLLYSLGQCVRLALVEFRTNSQICSLARFLTQRPTAD